MKLITKNLTGYLPNGDRYRIGFSDVQCIISTENRIVSVFLESYNELFNKWILEKIVCSSYKKSEEYKEALKHALIEAEMDFDMDLVKLDLNIAS